MDQCFTDLMDRGEHINLSPIMIKHIARIANTTRAHDLGYGFLLTWVFEHFGVELQKRVEAQAIDEVGSSTLMGCGFDLIQEEDPSAEHGLQTPAPPVASSSSSLPSVEVLQQEQQRLQAELTAVKDVLAEEKELSAERHGDLLAILAALTAKLSPLAPYITPALLFLPPCIMFLFLLSCVHSQNTGFLTVCIYSTHFGYPVC